MSALLRQQINIRVIDHVRLMSALPPKADMCGATRDVRFGPKADMLVSTNMFIERGQSARISMRLHPGDNFWPIRGSGLAANQNP